MFVQLTAETFIQSIEKEDKAICLCFKKLCPHCKNMEKVLEKFQKLQENITVFTLDIEEEISITDEYEAKLAPTLLIINKGSVVGKKAGLMNPKELKAFATTLWR